MKQIKIKPGTIHFDESRRIYETDKGGICFSLSQEKSLYKFKFSRIVRGSVFLPGTTETDHIVLEFDTGYLAFFSENGIEFKIEQLTSDALFIRYDSEQVTVEYIDSFDGYYQDCAAKDMTLKGLTVIDTGEVTVSEIKIALGHDIKLNNAAFYEGSGGGGDFISKMKIVGISPVIITPFPCGADGAGVIRKRNGQIPEAGFFADPLNNDGINSIVSAVSIYAKNGVKSILYRFYTGKNGKNSFEDAVLNNGKYLFDYYSPGEDLALGIRKLDEDAENKKCEIISNNYKCRIKDSDFLFFTLESSYPKALNMIKSFFVRGFSGLYPFFNSGKFTGDLKTLPLILLASAYFIDDIDLYNALMSSNRILLLEILRTRDILEYYIRSCIVYKSILNNNFILFSDENGFFIGKSLFYAYCGKSFLENGFNLPEGEWFSIFAKSCVSGGIVSRCGGRKKNDLFIKKGGVVPVLVNGGFEYFIFPENGNNEFRFSGSDSMKVSGGEENIRIDHQHAHGDTVYTIVTGRKSVSSIKLNDKEYPVVKSFEKKYVIINSSLQINRIDIVLE